MFDRWSTDPMPQPSIGDLLAALRAVAEPTRLRLLVLCSRGELTVSELAQILGQSQPRVSRHLKLLCEAGLLDRFREGSWVFYRVSAGNPASALARHLVAACGERDPPVALDLQRLAAIKRQRAERAAAYFSENAPHWDRIRSLYVDEREVEAALSRDRRRRRAARPPRYRHRHRPDDRNPGPQVGQALGIDQSREMLAIARVNLERAGATNGMVRLGDMYQLPLPDASFDAVVIHQVLHYADRPAAVIAEAARVLRPGGCWCGRFRAASLGIPARRARPSPARLHRCRGRRMVPRRRARTGAAAAFAGRSADRRDLDRLPPAVIETETAPPAPAPEQVLQP
jgi:DNA-binding transcriptional ArsR family regulator